MMQTSKASKTEFSWITFLSLLGLLAGLTVWTYQLLNGVRPWIFLSNVNLVFHEAGHVIFYLGGDFIGFLGGTLMQVLIPIVLVWYFWRQRSYAGALVCGFWLGDNLIEISVYIKDATSQTLPLLGGGTHDWYWLLTRLDLLSSDQIIGGAVYVLGAAALLVSLSGLVLYTIMVWLRRY